MSSLPQTLPQPHRRVATWWTSDAARERQRLIPPWIALGFGLMVALGLALLFPFRGLEAELGRAAARPDALQIAYLEVWLGVRPGREQLRYLLAEQLLAGDDLDRAEFHLARLATSADARLRDRADLLALDVELRRLQALSPGHPERPARQAALRGRFGALLARDLAPDVGTELARRAAALGAADLAALWYERLLAAQAALPAGFWEAAATQALQWGEHRLAARLLMQARATARTLAEQRRLFIAALRTLQAAGLFDEAFAAAERHLGALATDTQTLEFLTRLALAANRPDLAQRYAIRLLRITLLPAAIDERRRAGRVVPEAWLALQASLPPQLVRVQAAAAAPPLSALPERSAHLPFDDALYSLSYDVFIANSNLADALVVARSAVRQVPANLAWRRRLAQVADWSGQPDLALEQWAAIARQTGTAAAWAEVRKRALQLRAAELAVEALQAQARSRPADEVMARELARAYEELGEPEKALALLRPALAAHERSAQRREQLDLLAALAERAGDSATQRAALQALLRDFGAAPTVALRLAELEYALGDDRAAWAALQLAEPRARAGAARHLDYWRAYAQLARVGGLRAEAIRAYRLLLAAGEPGEDLLVNLAGLLEDEDPREAARLYELAWQRSGRPQFATQALYLRERAGDDAGLRAFLAGLTPAQLALLEADPRFLVQRATLRLADGDVGGARADAQRARALQPGDAGIEALLIWTLIAARDAPALRAQLESTAGAAADEPLLWAPQAAGWLALQEPRQAVRFLRRQARAGGDSLWMLGYADALDQLGSAELAWQVRRHAWLRRAALVRSAGTTAQRVDLERRLVPLAATLIGGDGARARLEALLAADPAAGRSATREAALAYFVAREQSEVAQAWLLGQYAQALERPAWAELSVALADNDGARLETLLDTMADWLPRLDRSEAAARVGRTAQAQSEAFDTLAARPEYDEAHRRLVDLVAGDRTGTAAQFAGAGWRSFRQRPIDEHSVQADGSVRLSPRIALGAGLVQITRSSTDSAQLVDPPRHDSTAQLDLGYDLGADAGLRVAIQQRDGLAREPGWRLDGNWRPAPRLGLTAAAGQGQPATDNAYLRVGAVRDVLDLGVNLRLGQREFAAATLTASRYHAQGGGAIGDGQVLRLEVGHDLRTEYPDLSLRATYAGLRYSAEPGVAAAMLPLLPPAARPAATNALLLPASTRQIGVALAVGATARERYSRAWRPFGVLAVTDDREGGTDYSWLLGAGGSLFGTDELSLVAAAGSGLGVQVVPFRSYGLRYRWMF
jgi:hypothetical protein